VDAGRESRPGEDLQQGGTDATLHARARRRLETLAHRVGSRFTRRLSDRRTADLPDRVREAAGRHAAAGLESVFQMAAVERRRAVSGEDIRRRAVRLPGYGAARHSGEPASLEA